MDVDVSIIMKSLACPTFIVIGLNLIVYPYYWNFWGHIIMFIILTNNIFKFFIEPFINRAYQLLYMDIICNLRK
jgi:hypothetical protein